MPLTVGPDPKNPGGWIWIDSATGQPAVQPGGPGTPYVPASELSPEQQAQLATQQRQAMPSAGLPPLDATTQANILGKSGRGGWNVVGRTQEVKNQATVDPKTGVTTNALQPTDNEVWAISGPNGLNDTITVQKTPDGYQVVNPPNNLPVSATANQRDKQVLGGSIYTQRLPGDAGYDPNDPNTWWQKSVVDADAQAKAKADYMKVLTDNGYTTAQATAIAMKTGPEIQQILASKGLSDAQAKQVLNNVAISNAKLESDIAVSQGQAAQAQASAGQLATATDIAKQKAPGEIAQTEEAVKTAQQARQIAGAPQIQQPGQGLYVTQANPKTGELTRQINPDFIPKTQQDVAARVGQLQQLAQSKRDELTQQMAAGTITGAQAAQQFDQWWTQNVEPQKTTLAAAQQTVGQEQARLQQEQERANYATAQTAGQNAVSAQQALLPYMHGPGWQQAVQQMATGWEPGNVGKPDNIDMNAALNFTPPDYNAISQKAVADALAHISPAAQAAGGTPNPAFMQAAQGMDISGVLNSTNYRPGGGLPPPGPPAAGTTQPGLASPFTGLAQGQGGGMPLRPLAPQTMPFGAIPANPWSNYIPPS